MKVHEGDRIAHRELDDEQTGTARTGIATEIIEDDTGEQQIIIAEYEDSGETVAFDSREITRIGRPIGSNRSPIILRPRHLLSMLKTTLGRMVILLSVIVGISLGIVGDAADLEPIHVAAALLTILTLVLFLDYVVDRRRIIKHSSDIEA